MAISIVQRGTAADSASSGTVSKAFGVNTTAGNAIIALVGINNNTTNLSGLSDGHNTYTLAANIYQASMNVGFKCWIATGITAAATTVSCSDNFNIGTIYIYEVSGLASANAFDTFASQQITGTACVSPSIATNNASELLLGFFGTEDTTADTYTVGTGYSNIQTNAVSNWSSACEEQIISSQGNFTAAAGGPSGQISQCAIIAFSATPVITGHNYGFNTNPLRPHAFSPGIAR